MEEAGREGLDGKSGDEAGESEGRSELEQEEDVQMRGSGAGRQQRRRKDDGSDTRVAAAMIVSSLSGQGVAAVVAWRRDGGWTPFREQPLEREETSFLSQMTARFCEGSPLPSYRAQNRPRRERAHLRPTTQNLNILIKIRFTKMKGFTNRKLKKERTHPEA